MALEIPQHESCPFCENIEKGETSSGTKCAVIEDLADTFAFLLPRQIATPHLVVIPKRHAATLLDLTADEAAAIARHMRRLAVAVERAFEPPGLGVFQNNGTAAGQSVEHYHMHLAPRYHGQPPGILAAQQPETPFEERVSIAQRIRSALD
ncbi:MAG TPA: HIT family protein [Dehalococcoidia bacterium]|nr:HIT family protein [Dehalococcoidia bacterium]